MLHPNIGKLYDFVQSKSEFIKGNNHTKYLFEALNVTIDNCDYSLK